MKQHQGYKIWVVGSLLLLGLLGAAQGQSEQLDIGNADPVLNYLGLPFPGTSLGDPNQAARVEVREVGTGITPPNPDTGEGNDTLNPLVFVTRMGHGVAGTDDTGMFSISLDELEPPMERMPTGAVWFARAYDSPVIADAAYYANSAPFQDVPPAEYSTTPTLTIVFQSQYLVFDGDDSDADNDGLSAWVEMNVYGSDDNTAYSDTDIYNDWFEALHGMELTEADPDYLTLHAPDFSTEPPPATNEYYVSWWAIPGVDYQLGYRDAMTDGLDFTSIWDGTATTNYLEVDVDDWVSTNVGVKGFFRYLIP